MCLSGVKSDWVAVTLVMPTCTNQQTSRVTMWWRPGRFDRTMAAAGNLAKSRCRPREAHRPQPHIADQTNAAPRRVCLLLVDLGAGWLLRTPRGELELDRTLHSHSQFAVQQSTGRRSQRSQRAARPARRKNKNTEHPPAPARVSAIGHAPSAKQARGNRKSRLGARTSNENENENQKQKQPLYQTVSQASGQSEVQSSVSWSRIHKRTRTIRMMTSGTTSSPRSRRRVMRSST